MPTQVLCYGRVSTNHQVISGDVQRDQCQQWFDRQVAIGELPEDSVYLKPELFDEAVSGKVDLFDRPQGQHITHVLNPGDVLVSAKDSRLFRSAGDAERSCDILNNMGIRIVILNLNVDTRTPVGRCMLAMFACFARFERELISERIREALQKRMEQGQWVGKPPLGYRLRTTKMTGTRNNELVPDEPSRVIGEFLAWKIHEGYSSEEAANLINARKMNQFVGMQRKGKPPTICSATMARKLAVGYICGWPPITRKRLVEKLGFDPFSIQFIRDNYEPSDSRSSTGTAGELAQRLFSAA